VLVTKMKDYKSRQSEAISISFRSRAVNGMLTPILFFLAVCVACLLLVAFLTHRF
jgi:hypothetical protein